MKYIFKYFAFSSRGITNSEKGIASPLHILWVSWEKSKKATYEKQRHSHIWMKMHTMIIRLYDTAPVIMVFKIKSYRSTFLFFFPNVCEYDLKLQSPSDVRMNTDSKQRSLHLLRALWYKGTAHARRDPTKNFLRSQVASTWGHSYLPQFMGQIKTMNYRLIFPTILINLFMLLCGWICGISWYYQPTREILLRESNMFWEVW